MGSYRGTTKVMMSADSLQLLEGRVQTLKRLFMMTFDAINDSGLYSLIYNLLGYMVENREMFSARSVLDSSHFVRCSQFY